MTDWFPLHEEVDEILKKAIFYWRLFFLIVLINFFLLDIINHSTFFAVLAGIVFFHGIPSLFEKMKEKD